MILPRQKYTNFFGFNGLDRFSIDKNRFKTGLDFSLETKLVPVRRRLAPDVTVSGHPDGVDNLEVDPDQCCETGSDGINKF